MNGTEQEHVREWRARRRERGEHRGLDRETHGRKQRRVGVDNADDAPEPLGDGAAEQGKLGRRAHSPAAAAAVAAVEKRRHRAQLRAGVLGGLRVQPRKRGRLTPAHPAVVELDPEQVPASRSRRLLSLALGRRRLF